MLNRLRLYSAIVLSIFVFLHLANVSLALISLELMDVGMAISIDPWRTVPGTVLLATACLVHFGLALWAICRRRTLRLNRRDLSQNVLGFLIPILLLYHLMGTGLGRLFWNLDGWYTGQLILFWYLAPAWLVSQFLLLLVVWCHAWVGFDNWLRLRPWYSACKPLISGFFLVVPTLALAGFVSGGMQARFLIQESGGIHGETLQAIRADWGLTDQVYRSIVYYTVFSIGGYIALVATALLGRRAWLGWLSRSPGSKVLYNGKVALIVLPGETLLESLRTAGIPHAAVCGGRGRCSTCRVRITSGLEYLAPPSKSESRVLDRISALPSVRLACQLRPTKDLEVIPLLAPSVGPEAIFSQPAPGEERELVVLFCDLREFTKLSEEKLPYDVVFILNRYLEAMGDAIEQAGGHIDKFIGDGVMALFGLQGSPAKGCTQALTASCLMASGLEGLNETLANELRHPLEMGIGIEVGRVIVGEMGYGESRSLTAIGSPVNTASRFQELCKEFDCQLIISVEAASRSAVDLSHSPKQDVVVRGQSEAREVYLIQSALDAEMVAAGSMAP